MYFKVQTLNLIAVQSQIKASLFTVLDENGCVLLSKIVASDEGKHVQKALQKIWATEGRTAITKFVFTDNSQKGIVSPT